MPFLELIGVRTLFITYRLPGRNQTKHHEIVIGPIYKHDRKKEFIALRMTQRPITLFLAVVKIIKHQKERV